VYVLYAGFVKRRDITGWSGSVQSRLSITSTITAWSHLPTWDLRCFVLQLPAFWYTTHLSSSDTQHVYHCLYFYHNTGNILKRRSTGWYHSNVRRQLKNFTLSAYTNVDQFLNKKLITKWDRWTLPSEPPLYMLHTFA